MIRIEHLHVFNFECAIRGMRNPYNSWDKSDTIYGEFHVDKEIYISYNPPHIGPNDLDLMKRLYKGGTEHRKYLRQIFVSMDITAPRYFWVEMDQYKVGVTTDSCSTMHTIHKKPFTVDDFSHEHLLHTDEGDNPIDLIVNYLNYYREKYLATKSKDYWWQMIQLLPQSYNQTRTITMSYENVVNMIKQRSNHKLDEWKTFCSLMLNELPYLKEIMTEDAAYWINICARDLHDVRTGNRLCYECPQCHHQHTYAYNYCPDCGKKLLINGDSND